jgi:hypothetical protein
MKPPSENVADAPNKVSEPNQVANTVNVAKCKGRRLPANMKSCAVFTYLTAKTPMIRLNIKKIKTNNRSIEPDFTNQHKYKNISKSNINICDKVWSKLQIRNVFIRFKSEKFII